MARRPQQKRATQKDDKKDSSNKQRLELEIKEREWNVSWNVSRLGKLVRLAPLVTAFSIFIGIPLGMWQWHLQVKQQRLETERLRAEKIANLKREFASDNPAIRIGAALALADYPKESVPVLIFSLGAINPLAGEEDTAFTNAVKTSLKQIGKDAISPLLEELKWINEEVKGRESLLDLQFKKVKGLTQQELKRFTGDKLVNWTFSLNTLFNKSPEEIKNMINTALKLAEKEGGPDYAKALKGSFPEEKIEHIINKMRNMKSSEPQLKVKWKNVRELLSYLLYQHHIERLDLQDFDLSGHSLAHAYLHDANLNFANLSETDLSGANLSNASLVEVTLMDAILTNTNLSNANLQLTALRGAKDLTMANLQGVKGLSKEDLEYAKSKGAIID
ncbi:MAG: hypothetical protein A3E19_07030 [Planctomycetes bacterium RIFCSPHIGHO2_12_FULL_52_36]|nr:MAG: hypothetical protein A3D89_04730 [Planctomycetes bacterium RIFCSPHIGHO2_02_FULL_52_58]OHB92991.1 MAG: hypothetical protein A3E19_07030 [Planctomycetes bacterium RIFCSPHIGHO2_12_FULL_52_36]